MEDKKVSKKHESAVITPALELVRKLHVANNLDPAALFDDRLAAIVVWCTPNDHPTGPEWDQVTMTPGQFCKPAEFVAQVSWDRNAKDLVTKIHITTDTIALSDQIPERFVTSPRFVDKHHEDIHDRPCDLEWAESKVRWLFKQAGVDLKKLGIPIVTCAVE